MQSKIIIGLCLTALLMFGAVLAQTNTNNQRNNSNTNNQSDSNTLANTTERIFPDHRNIANSNTSNTIRADQEREKEFLSEVACRYLTKADAKLILQSEVYGNGSLTSYVDKQYFCNYSATGRSDTKQVSVSLDIKVFAAKNEAEKAVAEKVKAARLIKSKTLNSGIGNAQTLTGIGDSAELIIIGNDSAHLYFQKDTTAFELSFLNLKYKKMTLKNLKLLAKKVAENFSATEADQR